MILILIEHHLRCQKCVECIWQDSRDHSGLRAIPRKMLTIFPNPIKMTTRWQYCTGKVPHVFQKRFTGVFQTGDLFVPK